LCCCCWLLLLLLLLLLQQQARAAPDTSKLTSPHDTPATMRVPSPFSNFDCTPRRTPHAGIQHKQDSRSMRSARART
jgi:hypothetical protein